MCSSDLETVRNHIATTVLGIVNPGKGIRKKRSKFNCDGTPKPKRALTGYLLFCNEMRKELGSEYKPMEAVSELARRWKLLTDAQKKEWNDKAFANERQDVNASRLYQVAAQ